MIEDFESDLAGANAAADARAAEMANVIPFPALRANKKLTKAWADAVTAHNKDRRAKHELPSLLDSVPGLIAERSMPSMPWPASWPEMARRARVYPGDCVGLVGSIGGGKTSKAIQVALSVMGEGLPVLWVNLELGRSQVSARVLANMNGVHASTVRDQWEEARIRHQLAAVSDMWHFVDRYDDLDEQLAAFRDAIELVWKVYRLPPLVVVDHIGQLITEANDARLAMLKVGRRFEKMALETKCWIMLLAQGSRSGQKLLTGQVELESAADAIGAAAESSILEAVCSNVIVTTLFKEDDMMLLKGHDLVSKARHTGLEGRIGVQFSKPGGVWTELDYLPSTPSEVKADNVRAKKDKHRTGPEPTLAATRADLDAAKAGNADAMRRVWVQDFLSSRGLLGATWQDLQSAPGAGRNHALGWTLQELERSGAVERIGGRWRLIARPG